MDQEGEDYQSTTITINSIWHLDNLDIRSTSAYTEFDTRFGVDADFWDIPLLFTERPEQFEQISQEIRISSPTKNQLFQWMLGAYLEESDYTAHGNSDWGFSYVGLPTNASTQRASTLDTSSFALFGEYQLPIINDLFFSIGGRYTQDKKRSTHIFNLGSLSDPFDDDPLVALIFFDPALFGWTETDIAASRSSYDFSPSALLTYRPHDELLLYASYNEGFKAGSFDLGLDSQPNPDVVPDEYEFDDETVESYELGGNAQLAQGRVNLRFAAYYNRYSGLQTLNFDGIASFTVGNAASAESYGVEISMDANLSRNISLNFALASGDHHYTSYRNGPCTASQALDTSPCFQDLEGAPLPRAPKRQANIGLEWRGNLGGLAIAAGVDAFYTSEIQFETDNDPFTLQDAFWKSDAFLSLQPIGTNWLLHLRGSNLTDKTTITSVTDLPLSTSGSYFATFDLPRTFEVKIEYVIDSSGTN